MVLNLFMSSITFTKAIYQCNSFTLNQYMRFGHFSFTTKVKCNGGGHLVAGRGNTQVNYLKNGSIVHFH